MKILTDDKQLELWTDWTLDKTSARHLVTRVAEAQLKADADWIIKWGNEDCPHTNRELHRHDCPYCWQELETKLEALK